MKIKPEQSVPAVLKRAFDAFLANDPISIAESFSLDARLTTQLDPQISQALGLDAIDGPIVASSAVGILRFYAYQLSMFEVKDSEIVAISDCNGGLDVTSRWTVKASATGEHYEGFNRNRYLLDSSGRKLTAGQGYCGLVPAYASLISN